MFLSLSFMRRRCCFCNANICICSAQLFFCQIRTFSSTHSSFRIDTSTFGKAAKRIRANTSRSKLRRTRCLPAATRVSGPETDDLVFSHQKICKRKAFTVLEFDAGYSILVMAHALLHHKHEFEETPVEIRKGTRCNSPFELQAVAASLEWIDRCQLLISSRSEPVEVVTLHHSDVSCTKPQGSMCHAYISILDVISDFILSRGTQHRACKRIHLCDDIFK